MPTPTRFAAAVLPWNRVVIASMIAPLLMTVSSPGARAEGIGVIAGGPARDDRQTLATALTDAIGARARIVGDAVGEARAQLAAGAVPVTTVGQFRRVRDMIDEGWRAYLGVQIDFAQNRLAVARSEAESLVALPGGAALYADAALRLGAVLLYRRSPDAQAVLALALALDPARPITLAEFSPDIVEAVDAVRVAPKVMRRLHVATTPPGAMVSVDGTQLGRAPLDVQVPRGQHLVVARGPQHRAAVQGVSVDAEAAVDLVLDRDEDEEALASGPEPGLAAPVEQTLVDATLWLADLDEVVVAAIVERHGGPALAMQRCAGAPARCTAVVEIGYGDRAGLAAAARAAWQAASGDALRHPPSVIGDSKPPVAPQECRVCRNPLVWTAVGAVVVGAVIAIVVTSGSKPPPVVIVNGPDFAR